MWFGFSRRYSSSWGRDNGGGFDLRAREQHKSARRSRQLGLLKSVPNASFVDRSLENIPGFNWSAISAACAGK
jgi:hypothetical protein